MMTAIKNTAIVSASLSRGQALLQRVHNEDWESWRYTYCVSQVGNTMRHLTIHYYYSFRYANSDDNRIPYALNITYDATKKIQTYVPQQDDAFTITSCSANDEPSQLLWLNRDTNQGRKFQTH
jgi:hypothetical protein